MSVACFGERLQGLTLNATTHERKNKTTADFCRTMSRSECRNCICTHQSLQRKSFGAWRGVSSAFCTSLSSLENVRLPRHYSCRDIEARRALQRHLYELLFKHCWQRDEDRLLTHVCISAEARVDLIVSCDQRCDAQTGGLHLWLPDTPFLSLSSTRVVYHWSKRL